MVNKFDQNDVLHKQNFKNMKLSQGERSSKEACASANFNEVLAFYCNNPNISLGLLSRQVCSFNSNY